LAEKRKLIDFERAAKISGSRFVIYREDGAKLMRALQ
jgi:seryl-tRNA synthetase